jgi:uncharacterized membrane protein
MATAVRVRETTRRETEAAPGPARGWFIMMLVGGLVGVVSGAWQLVERIAYAGGDTSGSICDINAVLSCNSVYTQWQSSALGIPNTLISVPVFAILASAGLAGLMGSRLTRPYLATLLGITVGMAGFLTWYMQQSAFAMGALCLFCTVCAAALVVTGIGLTRVVDAEQALGTGRAGHQLRLLVEARADLIIWVGLAALITLLLVLGLGL